jgi:hypothetical protein
VILMDGTDGEVSLFDGFYTAGFDGDVFESDYTRLEGIRDGDLQVTLKKDQPIWPVVFRAMEKQATMAASSATVKEAMTVSRFWRL